MKSNGCQMPAERVCLLQTNAFSGRHESIVSPSSYKSNSNTQKDPKLWLSTSLEGGQCWI